LEKLSEGTGEVGEGDGFRSDCEKAAGDGAELSAE